MWEQLSSTRILGTGTSIVTSDGSGGRKVPKVSDLSEIPSWDDG